jgi:hypothetical protein
VRQPSHYAVFAFAMGHLGFYVLLLILSVLHYWGLM